MGAKHTFYTGTWLKGPRAVNKPQTIYNKSYIIDRVIERLDGEIPEDRVRKVLSFVDYATKHIMDYAKVSYISIQGVGLFFIPPIYIHIQHYTYKGFYYEKKIHLDKVKVDDWVIQIKILDLLLELLDGYHTSDQSNKVHDEIMDLFDTLRDNRRIIHMIENSIDRLKERMDSYYRLFLRSLDYIRNSRNRIGSWKNNPYPIGKYEYALFNSAKIKVKRKQAAKAAKKYLKSRLKYKEEIRLLKEEYYKKLNLYKQKCYEAIKEEDQQDREVIEIEAFGEGTFNS